MFGFTLLQLYWLVLIARAAVHVFSMLTTGSFYDKSSGNRDPDDKLGLFQFRKRLTVWYFVALMISLWIGWNLTWACLGWSVGSRFIHFLTYFTGNTGGGTDALHVMIAQVLWEFHLARRYYESLSISIFSGRQAWSPIMALVIFINQSAGALSVVADLAPVEDGFSCMALSSLSWRPFVAVPLFLWATRVHHQSHLKLAKFRKNRAGHVVTSQYKMPKGEWFDVVDCPHYFAEVLIYVAMGILLGCGACTWWLLTAYVTLIHFFLANSTHDFYVKKFENYPKDRKILIPYVY